MTYRRLNLIVYRPGHCGHFLKYLLGLSTQVYSLCGGLDRSQAYSFRRLHQRHGSWKNFHTYHHHRHGGDLEQILEFLNKSQHPMAVIGLHPYQLTHYLQPYIASASQTQVHYYRVKCSLELDHQLQDFMVNRFDPTVKNVVEQEFELASNTFVEQSIQDYIDLDLIVNPESFYAEYLRVAELMSVPTVSESVAQEFYRDWRRERFGD
jgi:hypothetical protein